MFLATEHSVIDTNNVIIMDGFLNISNDSNSDMSDAPDSSNAGSLSAFSRFSSSTPSYVGKERKEPRRCGTITLGIATMFSSIRTSGLYDAVSSVVLNMLKVEELRL